MSHDLRRSNGPTLPQAAARAQLGRPSLFTGAEDGDPQADDTQRVRLLSTLESTRRPVRQPPSRAQRVRQRRQAWQRQALIALMGAGVLALLGSFVLVVRDGHAPGAEARMLGTTGTRMQGGAAPASAPPAAPLTATIENTVPQPPIAHAGVPPSPASAASAHPVSIAVTAGETLSRHKATLGAAAHATPRTAPSIPRATPPQLAQEADAPPRSQRVIKTKEQDDDVALLEAMFAHAGQRRSGHAAPSAGAGGAEALLHRCKALTGADAATCRAKVCVQHPKAQACHRD